jgi:transcriptional regulator with PAS, ATPase and Fis domain
MKRKGGPKPLVLTEEQIRKAIDASGGSRLLAAKLLKCHIATLRKKIVDLGIDVPYRPDFKPKGSISLPKWQLKNLLEDTGGDLDEIAFRLDISKTTVWRYGKRHGLI